MNIHLELSRPLGDVSRWNKIYQRLDLLNKYYPFIYNKHIIKTDVQYKEYNKLTELCKKWVILGEYAMKYFKFPSKYKSNSNIFILTQSLDDIKRMLDSNGFEYNIISYSNMLMLYYALSFIQPPNLNINNLLVYCYLLQHIKESNHNNKIIKRFSLPCIGHQSTFEDLRRERDNAHKLYKKTHSKKIYNNYFFRYIPHKQKRKKTQKHIQKHIQ